MNPWLIAGALVMAIVVAMIVRRFDRWTDSRRRRRRARRALEGEDASEVLLEEAGYRVFDRQVPGAITVLVDGAATDFELRADFVVGDGERNYVAEVKTGERAPSIGHAATRRQLLEYSIAFDVDGILLVDADTGDISEISFEIARGDGQDGRLLANGELLVDEERARRLPDL